MLKIFVLKSLSALALLCLLASHFELTLAQTNDVIDPACYNSVIKQLQASDTVFIFTKSDILARLMFINNGAQSLDKDIHAINNGAGGINDLKRVNDDQAVYTMQLDFMQRLLSQFTPVSNEIKNALERVAINVDVNTVNISTLTNNLYQKNASVQILNFVIDTFKGFILTQYPFLKIPLELLLKFSGK